MYKNKLTIVFASLLTLLAPLNSWASTQDLTTQTILAPPPELLADPLQEAQGAFNNCVKNPLACAQNPQDILSSLNGVPQQVTSKINSYFNQQVANLQQAAMGSLSGILKNSGLSNIAATFGLGGLFGGSNSPITSSEIQANSPQSITKVAAQSIANEAALNYLNARNASNGGEYRVGTAAMAATQGSQAIAQSVVGADGLNQNNAIAAISTQNVKESSDEANSDKDSSLDAIQGTNKILSKIASQNDLIVGALNDQKVLEAQSLKQAAITQQTLDNQQRREDSEIERYRAQVERTTDYIQNMFSGKQ